MNQPKISPGKKYDFRPTPTWPVQSVHVFDERCVHAIQAAIAAQRPLLIRGEPGTGKSQLARAAAKALNRKFVYEVIKANTEIDDLWYRFDAISRLGHAQVLSATAKEKSQAEIDAELDPRKFISPGVLWWAFAWDEAQKQHNDCKYQLYEPDPYDEGNIANGVVLLLDEIDKADTHLHNSLLETLDSGRYHIPWCKQTICAANDSQRPLVIITTNEDRQLPGPFVRRCLVLELWLPDEQEELVDFLCKRGREHFPNAICSVKFDDKVLINAATQLYADRQQAYKLGVTPPGQAEYLDILRALAKLASTKKGHLKALAQIQDFALKKFPKMQKEAEKEQSNAASENNSVDVDGN